MPIPVVYHAIEITRMDEIYKNKRMSLSRGTSSKIRTTRILQARMAAMIESTAYHAMQTKWLQSLLEHNKHKLR